MFLETALPGEVWVGDLALRVRARREQLGLSQSELARRLGKRQQTLNALEGGAVERPGYLIELARVLDVTPDWLLYGDGEPPALPPNTPVSSPQVIIPPPGSGLPPINLSALPYDLPVYLLRASSLTVSEKLEGFTMQQDAAVEFCRRPPGLAGAANAYAVYAPNDGLFRFEQGELLVVAPDRPARPGDNVVVSVTAEGGEVVRFVGRLASRDREGITIAVDRPSPVEERFAAAAVASIHKILNMAEALGF